MGDKRLAGKDSTSTNWVKFQIKVAIVLCLWLASQLYLIGGIPSPDHSLIALRESATSESPRPQDSGAIDDAKKIEGHEAEVSHHSIFSPENSLIAPREPANALRPQGSGAIDDMTKIKGDDEAEVSHHSIFELSLFGNKSPDDFQFFTPHAPSCNVSLEPREVSFTLVSQLSNDRMWMIPHICERWGNNPMSIVVLTDRTVESVRFPMISGGCSDEHLSVQTVGRTMYDPDGTEYPVNVMRNLAMSAVKTTHVLYADVDFWPSADLFSIMSDNNIKERLASDPMLAAVLPAFQMQDMCKDKECREKNILLIPRNKVELSVLHRMEKVSSFDPTNAGGHGSTQYETWLVQQDTATFVDLPCIKSNRYEPYMVLRYCSELPPFQEGFTGYGKNKMTVGSSYLN
jgi:hypothetical protein